MVNNEKENGSRKGRIKIRLIMVQYYIQLTIAIKGIFSKTALTSLVYGSMCVTVLHDFCEIVFAHILQIRIFCNSVGFQFEN